MRQHGVEFGLFVDRIGYWFLLNGDKRLPKYRGFVALRDWLTLKVSMQPDLFGWPNYSLSDNQIQTVSDQASNDWRGVWQN